MERKKKSNEPSFKRFVHALERYEKLEEKPDFAFKQIGMEIFCLYLFKQQVIAEKRCKFGRQRLEKMKNLKAPEVIIKSAENHLAKIEIEKNLLDSLVSVMYKADYLCQKRIIGQHDMKRSMYILEDAIEATTNRTCIHCARSVMDENGKWVCCDRIATGEIFKYSTGFATACTDWHFWLDDFAGIDYHDFITKNEDFGNEFLEKIGKEKDEDDKFEYVDRLEYAISCHHKSLLKLDNQRILESTFPKEELKKMGYEKGDSNE